MPKSEWFKPFFDKDYVGLLKAQMDNSRTQDQVDFIEKHLRLRPPAHVLDVACGFGRHSIELAKRGYQVVGVDFSQAMLTEARRLGRNVTGVSFQHADMRNLKFAAEFDAVINLFTSFGYFRHTQNLKALQKMANALRPGGKLFLDTRDRDFDTEMHKKRGDNYRWWWPVGTTHIVMEELDFDPKKGLVRSQWHILRRHGSIWKKFDKSMALQIYSQNQWDKMLKTCGLRRERFLGDYSKERIKIKTGPRLIVLATK